MSHLEEEDTARTQMARALLHLYTSFSTQCWQLIDCMKIYHHICSSHWGARWAFCPLFMAGIDTAVRYRHFSECNLETKDQWETEIINKDEEIGTAKCDRMEYVFFFFFLIYIHRLFNRNFGPSINKCLFPQIPKETCKMEKKNWITKTWIWWRYAKKPEGFDSSQMTGYWFLWKVFLVRYESVIEIYIRRQ